MKATVLEKFRARCGEPAANGRQIKDGLSSGQSTRSLAAEFGCSLSTINHIKYRRCWAWL